MPPPEATRANEWWVPRIGPERFRLLVGLSFYPYTLMNASYVVIGSLVAPVVHYDRVSWLFLVYLMAVGIGAHSLDATGPGKPWGEFLSRRQLFALALLGLVPAIGIGLFLALSFSPILLPIGALELFFLLAYNMELFGGWFHNDFVFALSWGFMPCIAGYALQSGSLGLAGVGAGLFGFFTAKVEISASRPYKALKKGLYPSNPELANKLESVLKAIVASVLSAALFLLLYRAI